MGNVTKVYTLQIEASQAQQQLAQAGKLFEELKTKSAAANQEVKEAKQIYQENSAELKTLVAEQKKLEAAKKAASAGAPAMQANANLDKNLAQQKQLNSIVQESKIDYQDAKAAAEAAGAAVGKQAGVVKALAGSVKDYGAAAKAAQQEFEPGTVGALRQEVEQLRNNLKNLTPESQEAAVAIQSIASKESELRKLANATRALNPEIQTRAFGAFNQALIGAVGISQTAVQVLGLSKQTAEEYAQKMQALTGVLYSMESVSKFLNGENLSLIKTLYTGAKAWLGFGTAAEAGGAAATTAGRATKVALASSGIGLIILAVGALIALWNDLGSTVRGSESSFTKYKAAVVGGFDGMLAAGKDYLKFWLQVFTLDFSGAANTAKNAGRDIAGAYAKGRAGVIDVARRAELAHEIEQTARYVEIIRSRGEDTLALEVANARRKIDAEKANSKEQLDAVKEYIVLKNQLLKRQDEEEKALALARLEGLEKVEAANGRAVLEQQRAVLQKKLQDQIEADLLLGKYESAAHAQILAEIQALDDAHQVEQTQKRHAAELARLDASISLRAAKGQEAYAQEVARAERELQILKSAAQRDEAAIIAAEARRNDLIIARAYELTQRRHALKLAELDAIISLENTKGQDSYNEQVKREEKALAYMQQLGTRNLAAEKAQQSKLDNLRAAHALKEAADERAAELARLNARIALLQVLGQDATDVQVQLKEKELAALLAAATRNEAAIIAKEGEIQVLVTQQAIQDIEKRRALEVEAFDNRIALLEKQGKDTLALRLKFAQQQVALDTDNSEKGLARLRADTQALRLLQAEMAQRGPDLGGIILKKLFGLKEEDIQKVKADLNGAFAEIAQNINSVVGTMLAAGMQEADAQLQAAQDRLSALGSQLSEASNKRQSDEAAIQSATGARRDALLIRLEKERASEAKLASEKAKAAKDAEQAQKTKAKLDKEQQQISAASTAIEAVLLGIKAAQTLVDIASKGKFGVDNIVLAIAAAATLGTGIYAMKNAAKSFADGGVIGADGVLRGPRHAQGGIPFTIAGQPGFEAEGGEGILPVDATSKNADVFQLLRTKGRTKRLTVDDFYEISQTRIAPPPTTGRYANGGVLGGMGMSSAATPTVGLTQVVVEKADLSELLATNRAALAHLQAISGTNQQIASYGPAQLNIGPFEATKIHEEKQKAQQAEARATL